MSAATDSGEPAFAELVAATNYSFLRGASHPSDMVAEALRLGHKGIGIADRNTVAGVVRAYRALRDVRADMAAEGVAEGLAGEVAKRTAAPATVRPEPVEGHASGDVLAARTSTGSVRTEERKGIDLPQGAAERALSPGVHKEEQPPSAARLRQALGTGFDTLKANGEEKHTDGREAGGQETDTDDDGQRPDTAERLTVLDDFRLVVGARLVFADGTPDIVAYPVDRAGWGRLTRLLTLGNRRAIKGACELHLADLIDHAQGLLLIAIADDGHEFLLRRLAKIAPLWIAATMHRRGDDQRRLARLQRLSQATGIPLLATCDVLYASAEQRPLHDVVTCIREGTTLAEAGQRLLANAERHLKPADEMARLFRQAPQAVTAWEDILARISFTLDHLLYEYPHEPVPAGWEPQAWLEHETLRLAAEDRYPGGIPDKVRAALDTEFELIHQCGYAYYFLTVYDAVKFARSLEPPILCQGRGSAANSAVCYCLGITSVDPAEFNLLFSRFVSAERKEPPDIDVDFEHERREEVIQHIYERYGRSRAGIAATVIHFRPRSAVREVGKVLGLSEDVTTRLTSTVWGSFADRMETRRFADAGFDLAAQDIARLKWVVDQLLHTPRHLSQHVGGFVLTEGRLDELVPIHNAAMADRTFIEWDKEDIDTLKLMKVDVLALGMLTCIRKAFDLMREHDLGDWNLATVPQDSRVYDMLCKGDSIGVFQVESRAQINMLPRLQPRKFYDLAVQVAIVRPGPIEGDMVHPYLKRRAEFRRTGQAFVFPEPKPPHPADELHEVLGLTFGVPLFQEQAMKLAITAAAFTPDEANQLRRAMATFRNVGTIGHFEEKMVGGMVARGYEADFARRCYAQIKGFGSYGFPESHAISFALLVYVSSWLKCFHPAVFACAILNSQPMGFYAPAQLVRDAREHGVEVRAADINASGWDNSLERRDDGALALRIGLRQIDGFREGWADALVAARENEGRFDSIEALGRRAALPPRALRRLADADACSSIDLGRRDAAWAVRRMPGGEELPLFAAARARELAAEPDAMLPAMPLAEEVSADYQTTRLSLKQHPMHFLRATMRRTRILSSAELAEARNGTRAKVAGVVLVRQRPGKGNAIFVTLEDETGIVNILLWARLFERYRRPLMASRLMEAHGVIQKSEEGVVHLMADRIVDRTDLLDRLSDEGPVPIDLSRADVFAHPQAPRGGHPRDARVIPKSRDFH